MGGAVVGPIVGGSMLANFWWGSVFLLAVPVTLLLLVTGARLLPEYRNPEAGRLDPASVALSLVCILPAVYGVTELARNSGDAVAGPGVAVGVVAGVAFVMRQRRLTHPLLELSLFSSRVFRGAVSLGLVGGAVQGGSLLMINLYLQMVKGYTPLRAGLWMVPPALAMFFTIGLGPALARTIRPAYITAVGMAASAVGYVVISQVGSTGVLAVLVAASPSPWPGSARGCPWATTWSWALPRQKAGSASATVETGGQFGVAAGIAVLGSVGAAVYRTSVKVPSAVPPRPPLRHESIAGAVTVSHQLPAPVAADLLDSARSAFTAGLHTVSIIGAAMFAGLAVLALVTLRQVSPSGQAVSPETGGAPGAVSEPTGTESGTIPSRTDSGTTKENQNVDHRRKTVRGPGHARRVRGGPHRPRQACPRPGRRCRDLAISADPVENGRVNMVEIWESQEHLDAWRAVANPPAQITEFLGGDVQKHIVSESGPAF